MPTKSAERIAAVSRGPLIESVHHGHIAVVDTDCRLIAYLGLADYVTFARSTAKWLQALPVVESGPADRFRFTKAQLALLCASHNGETVHIDNVRQMLAQMKLTEQALRCGAHAPFYQPEAERLMRAGEPFTHLHNNCSGKHSGMLALALQLGAPIEGYMAPEHPVQRIMLETVSDMAGLAPADVALGTDGCGVPVFGMPLHRLAFAFARFGSPDRLTAERGAACRRLLDAIRSAPVMIAGTGRFDTHLLEATNGRIAGKMGAEGVFAITAPDKGWGIAIKIEDGSPRALYPAAVETLVQLGLLSDDEQEKLAAFHKPAVRNWEGTVVGRIEPAFRLHPTEGAR